MSEEAADFFRIKVPLPGSPLKFLNAWLVRGKNRSLLIDNGFNTNASRDALIGALKKLGQDRTNLDFFISHLHSDHNGLTAELAGSQAQIFCSREDGEHINAFIMDPQRWPRSLAKLAEYGFPEEELTKLINSHPGKVYASRKPLNFTWVKEGDDLQYGRYHFLILDSPGHTPGHQVLYEPERNFLVCGDHILAAITPNISKWEAVSDSLGDYLQSLDKIKALGAELSFPGHREVIKDTCARISQLQCHHHERLEEIKAILQEKPDADAWQVASRMKWNLRGSWQDFPVAQKCFAVLEAVAHLDHFRATQIV